MVVARAPKGGRLFGADIRLGFPSVGATETLLMAAVTADGATTIENAAQEPEIVDLARLLRSCGARIAGEGTARIEVEGVTKLSAQGTFTAIPDRIEAGTFLCAAAAVPGSVIEVWPVVPAHLAPATERLRAMGCDIRAVAQDRLVLRSPDASPLRAVDITTKPFPGFPTDLQAPFAAVLASAQGRSVVTETVFEGRFRYAEGLRRLGADVRLLDDHDPCALAVRGVDRLRGAHVRGTDLRAGAAFVVAALSADGSSTVGGLEHVDRGYELFDEKLQSLGARLVRIPCPPPHSR